MLQKIKNIFYTLMWFLISINLVFAEGEADWIFWNTDKTKVREWNIHIDDIPKILRNVIDILLEIAWTIAIIFIIVWAYKILFGSLTSEKTEWKNTIIMALTWFAISTLAWFIIKFIIDNFS